jgi:hypothetical protein
VVADETGRGPTASVTKVRLRWLAIVVALMALLTAGWPLLNSAVANRQRLASGATITVGSGPASSGTVTVGSGWYARPEQSNPIQEYVLTKGAVVLDIRHVSLVNRQHVAGIWGGMREVLSVTHPGFTLRAPVTVWTARRMMAITGAVFGPHMAGTATVVPGPSREFAIAMLVLAPRGTNRTLIASAHRVVLSLLFSAPDR